MTAVAPENVAVPVDAAEPAADDTAAHAADDTAAHAADDTAAHAADDLVLADMLVEEISIDGMCGVY